MTPSIVGGQLSSAGSSLCSSYRVWIVLATCRSSEKATPAGVLPIRLKGAETLPTGVGATTAKGLPVLNTGSDDSS